MILQLEVRYFKSTFTALKVIKDLKYTVLGMANISPFTALQFKGQFLISRWTFSNGAGFVCQGQWCSHIVLNPHYPVTLNYLRTVGQMMHSP